MGNCNVLKIKHVTTATKLKSDWFCAGAVLRVEKVVQQGKLKYVQLCIETERKLFYYRGGTGVVEDS